MSTLRSTDAVAVPGANHVIDMLHPITGRTLCYNKTLAEVQATNPGAEIVNFDAWCEAKAKRQRSPIIWARCTKARYWDMLGCLPPAAMHSGGFLVGEPADHDAGNGQPRYDAFRQRGTRYYAANRPMTRDEFAQAMKP